MRGGWGVGVLVAILLPVALALFGILSEALTLASIVFLVGLWTFVSAFAFAERRDRLYMVGWGVILALFSTVFVVKPQYALGLVVLGMVAMVVVYAAGRPRVPTAPSQSAASSQPAA